MKRVKSFFKNWRGSMTFVPALIMFIGSKVILNSIPLSENPILSFFWVTLVLSKVFLAEFIGSLTLYINQREYFKVIHQQNDPHLELKYKTQSWRESAIKYYALFCVMAGLILALT